MKLSKFKRLELAVLADTFDGTISKKGRAELVQAFNAFKAEYAALQLKPLTKGATTK